jgi:hypothetical protein
MRSSKIMPGPRGAVVYTDFSLRYMAATPMAFSSEMDTGSREENASKTKG